MKNKNLAELKKYWGEGFNTIQYYKYLIFIQQNKGKV
jgi:hypothetical protein